VSSERETGANGAAQWPPPRGAVPVTIPRPRQPHAPPRRRARRPQPRRHCAPYRAPPRAERGLPFRACARRRVSDAQCIS
jgi:hypothetical protein